MLSKIKERFTQQPLKFDDLENILPIDNSVDFEETDDVDAKDLFISGGRKGSFNSRLSMSPSAFFGTPLSARSSDNNNLGPRKNSFNRLFLNSPSNDENVHPNAIQEGIDKKAQTKPLAFQQSADVFKMRGLAETLPTFSPQVSTPNVVSPSYDNRFTSTRPTRDSPSAANSATKVPNIFRDTMFQASPPPVAQRQPTITRHSQVWSNSDNNNSSINQQYKQEDDEEKEDYIDEYELHYGDVDVDTLFSKVRHNHSEFVVQALSNGVDPNIVDNNGNTMLHICAQNNNKKITMLLLNSQHIHVDLNIVNRKSHTPLDYAEKYGHHKLAQYLESRGAVSGLQTEVRGPTIVATTSATRFR